MTVQQPTPVGADPLSLSQAGGGPDPDQPMVVVVVLNWNGRDDTLACLGSLRGITYGHLRVIVVDNGSTDGSAEAIRSLYPEVVVVETGQNLGFAGGNNVGMQEALKLGADFVLLLNNDTVVPPNLVDAFAAAARRFPDAGVLAAKIYYLSDRDRIWYAGARWRRGAATFEHLHQGTVDDGGPPGVATDTEYPCGCGMFVRSSVLRDVGLLEEDYFLLFEDADWGYRCRKVGYRCLVIPEAIIWHKVSASLGGFRGSLYQYFYTRNRLLWARRHLPFLERAVVWVQTALDLAPLFRAAVEAVWPLVTRLATREAYWAIRQWPRELSAARRDPQRRLVNRARRRAVADYLLRRFGDCPPDIRAPGR